MRALVLLAVCLLAACDLLAPSGSGQRPSNTASPTPGPGDVPPPPPDGPPPGEPEPGEVPPLPSVAICEDAPAGRGYLGLAGEHLEAERSDVAAGYDTRRPYRNFLHNSDWVVAVDLQKAVGNSPVAADPERRDPGFGASFGITPPRWYNESEVGTFAVYVTFNYAFKVCLREFDAERALTHQPWYEHAAFEPTEERARDFCSGVQAKAWLRDPSAEELQACVDLALDLGEEPDFKQRWAYVCASVLSSPNWLSN